MLSLIKAHCVAALDTIRRLPDRWRKAGYALVGLLACEIGSRIAVPTPNAEALNAYFQRNPMVGLLDLYNRLTSSALSRGSVLALGIMPYVTARIYMRLVQVVSPAVKRMSTHEAGRRSLTRWTRGLTVGFALVQSYGYARFTLSIPGVVAQPGTGYIVQTMVVLTAAATFVMWLAEQVTSADDEQPSASNERAAVEDRPALALPPSGFDAAHPEHLAYRHKTPV